MSHLAAVDLDVAVADHLARLRAAGAEAHAIDDVVEAALERDSRFSPVMPFGRAAFSKVLRNCRSRTP